MHHVLEDSNSIRRKVVKKIAAISILKLLETMPDWIEGGKSLKLSLFVLFLYV